MVIYIYPNGSWQFSWERSFPLPSGTKIVDIDRWDEYDLTDEELNLCIEAVEYAESRRSGDVCQVEGLHIC